ncbi:4Fe-4S dicluster domain-containing protein [Spirosoma foliorum]|uniref:4Fe-4S dicluster domain-containing protein n=1 Tax=Spirosoma foliorum TaxID=2710596 RepID=A0A7G5GSI2_9BACT|nr:4Fe-4S dicluster domain-containing protein [Spirosoma foliorum]QMW01824.1 4Fe-4S dicluster domain-containing protein [Spirosoma foliorum]
MSYFKDIQSGIRTTIKGLGLTLRHLRNATHRRTPEGIASDNYFDLQNGLVTLQYPHEQLPIPDNGRYRLRNEIDDCIVCDKCAKVCPVDCITIDAIKATEEVGRASDGSPIRLYAAKFDIDMAKCCYCGLCTVVCPTECLTMDKKFDYSEFELGKLTYNFSNLTEEESNEKRSLYEQFLVEKEAAKAAQIAAKAAATAPAAKADTQSVAPKASPARPVFRPTVKPAAKVEPANSEGSSIEHPLTDATPQEMEQIAQGAIETTKHPVFEPTQKPVIHITDVPADAQQVEAKKPVVPKTGFRPSMKPSAAAPSPPSTSDASPSTDVPAETGLVLPTPSAKPAGFRPTMKPPVKEQASEEEPQASEPPKAKPAFRPTMKPAKPVEELPNESSEIAKVDAPVAKPAGFRPSMKPKVAEPEEGDTPSASEPLKAKPAFRPTMKPGLAKPEEPKSDISITPEDAYTKPVEESTSEPVEATVPDVPAAKPAGFRPTMKPKAPVEPKLDTPAPSEEVAPVAKPAGFRPTMKPKATTPEVDEVKADATINKDEKTEDAPVVEPAKPKPAFRPTMKPKPRPNEGESA